VGEHVGDADDRGVAGRLGGVVVLDRPRERVREPEPPSEDAAGESMVEA
jgi:hypothetical protein